MAKIGDIIPVPYIENASEDDYICRQRKIVREITSGKIVRAGECTIAIVQSRASKIFEYLDMLESNKLYQNDRIREVLFQIIKQKRENPQSQIKLSESLIPDDDVGFNAFVKLSLFIDNLNGLLKMFQLVLVEVDPNVQFWYLLKDCNPESLSTAKEDDGEISYKHHIPIGYKYENNNENFNQSTIYWNDEDIEFHKYCTNLEDSIPGVLTTVANWTKYGMMATGIRRFDIIEDLLRSPYVNRPELIPYFSKQYKQDYQNLVQMQTPAAGVIYVYRGSFGYNKIHENFKVSTILATTNEPLVAEKFANTKKQVKEFIIPAGYPVVDLRLFNPDEREIILLPPISFKLEKLGEHNNNFRSNNSSYYNSYNSYSIKQNKKGGKTRKNKHKK